MVSLGLCHTCGAEDSGTGETPELSLGVFHTLVTRKNAHCGDSFEVKLIQSAVVHTLHDNYKLPEFLVLSLNAQKKFSMTKATHINSVIYSFTFVPSLLHRI